MDINQEFFDSNIIEKAPHYFYVFLDETFISMDTMTSPTGPYYTFKRGSMPVNVYGLSEDQVDSFDESRLINMIIGSRRTTILWEAESFEDLMTQISIDPSVVSGACKLSEHAPRGSILELPDCARMHLNKLTKELYCGKPTNKYGDGSFGGCVLQGYDQDFDGCDFLCPVQKFFASGS